MCINLQGKNVEFFFFGEKNVEFQKPKKNKPRNIRPIEIYDVVKCLSLYGNYWQLAFCDCCFESKSNCFELKKCFFYIHTIPKKKKKT